jgi:biotin transport system substrate-specific component
MNMTSQEINTKKTRTMGTKALVLTAMFTAIICVLSMLTIPTQPIPFTLSLLAIFLTGALLPPRYALISVLIYLLLGAFGLPVFAGMKGGVQVLTGVTGGYLMSYPIMALVTALFQNITKKARIIFLILGMLLALTLCYLIGTLWFVFVTDNNFYTALTLCVFPYVLFDLLKIALATSISTVIRTALKHII